MNIFVLENKAIVEVDKTDKEILEWWVCYKWYNKDWEEIEAYYMDEKTLKPMVRELLEDDTSLNIKWILILIAFIIWIIFIWYMFFGWNDKQEVSEVVNQVERQQVMPNNQDKIDSLVEKEEVEKEEVEKNKNQINELNWLKQQSEIETLRLSYKNEELSLKVLELSNKNNSLLEENNIIKFKNEELENEIKRLTYMVNEKKNRLINYPEDQFIYYLWDHLFYKCENTADDKLRTKCKDLYYNFVRQWQKTEVK